MQKAIALKYPDICWECKTMKPKGTLVMWLGRKQGIYCWSSCWFNHRRKSREE